MKHPPSRTPDTRPRPAARVAAALVLAGGALGCAAVAAGGPWGGGRAPFPYVWRDVAAVHVVCALPFGVAVAAFLHRWVPAAGAVGIAALVLAAGALPLLVDPRPSAALGVLVRAAPALGLTTAAALLVPVLLGGRRVAGPARGWPRAAALIGLGLALGLVLPATYVRERCRHESARLGELVEQSRYGEARPLIRDLLALDARGARGELPRVAAEVERVVGDLESRVADPLPDGASAGARFDRARHLAMLGRTDAALGVLDGVAEPAFAPEVETLRGTIHESGGEWDAALASYRRARAEWEVRPRSEARAQGLLRAATGVAYCQRKLGCYAEAEATYREVLALSPTADTHFLLAQFYEDAQQADRARAHARRAMALAPERYGRAGEELINKLAVYHFGCFGVFSAEGDTPRNSRDSHARPGENGQWYTGTPSGHGPPP